MANKRQHNESPKCPTAAKKSKPEESEFNGTVFKSMLKDPSKELKGLQTFIIIARRLPCADLHDVVEGYIKVSVECSEIFKLLEAEGRSEYELMQIFQSLEMILLRTASDLSHLSMVGSNIVKKMVSTHMNLLLTSLQAEEHRFVRQCLLFLSAMVSQGAEAARDIYSHTNFSKGISGLALRRDKKGKPDIRMAYIQFVLSFLISGDNTTIGQILESKDLLAAVFSNGLKEDRISIVNLILSTLQTRVVQNKAIRKTQKVRFFSASILAKISSLYKWNGIVDVGPDDEEEQKEREGGQGIVRELVHKFLLDLCCSRKYGISFYDPSLGTVGRLGNIVLLQFLVGLKQLTEDEMVAELVVNILKDSPDILTRYFKETQVSFTPRIKSSWQNNITLLKKIFEAQPEMSKAFQTSEMIPLPRLLSMVLVTCLPSACNKLFFTQGLNLPNVVVQHTTLSLLVFILKRAQKNIEHCLDKRVWETSDIYNPAMMEEFVQLFREALSKILPDTLSIISKWQSLSKEKEEGAKTANKEQQQDDKKRIEEKRGEDDPQLILVKVLLLQVMCLYQRVVPHLLPASKFSWNHMFKGIHFKTFAKRENSCITLLYSIQLKWALNYPKNSNFCVRAPSGVQMFEQTNTMWLVDMLANTTSNIQTKSICFVIQVLRDSGVFEHTSKELDLWLDHLVRLDPSQQETVIRFLDHALVRVVCNQHVYTEKATGMVQEAAYLQANLSGQEGDEASIPISHIDDVLDMVDVILEGSEGDIGEIGPSLTDDVILQTFPFSVIVPAVLEARNNLPASSNNKKGFFIHVKVLFSVINKSRYQRVLCLSTPSAVYEYMSAVLYTSPHPSLVTFYHYYSQWLPKPTQDKLFIAADTTEGLSDFGLSALLKASYSEGSDAFLQEEFKGVIREALDTLDLYQFPMVVNQVLLYLRTYVANFNSLGKGIASEVLGSLMTVLNSLILKLLSSEQTTQIDRKETPEDIDLFLDTDLIPTQNLDKEQIVRTVLRSVFKHPAVEQWFLALELSSLPPHTLNPVRLKQLCGCLTENTLTLLESSAAILRDLEASDIISTYLTAAHRAVLKELQEKGNKKCSKKESASVRVLLALHEYLDSSSLKELVSSILLLPQECLLADESELSVYGRVVLKLLTDDVNRLSEEHSSSIALSQAHLRGLAALLTSCQCVQLEDFLFRVLSREPGSAKLIQSDVLLHCIQRDGPSARAIAVLLLQNCSTHVLSFERWCLEPSNLSQVTIGSDSFLHLLNAYLQKAAVDDPSRPKDIQRSVLKAMKKAFMSGLWSAVQDGEVEVLTGLQVDVLSNLIRLAAGTTDLARFMRDLPEILQKPDSNERWKLADSVSVKLSESPELGSEWRKSLLDAVFHWLTAVYKEQKNPQAQQEEAMLKRLQSLMQESHTASSVFYSVVINLVNPMCRYRYLDPVFLETLNHFLEIMYGMPESPKELLPLATIHMMITSHSRFLSTMLSRQDSDGLHLSKEALVSLLLTVVRKCPEVCNSSHFLVNLGAYGASMSTTDQKILLLLQEYEKNNISLTEFQFVLWGPAAVEHHKARKSLGPSLWQKPSSEQLLSLLSTDNMLNTITHFPQQRYIIPQDGKDVIYTPEGKDCVDPSSLYDPSFLLPLFSFILRPECEVDCQKFVTSHALGVTVAALSSYDWKVRAAAYQTLGSFYQHLEGARFREKGQVLYLLDTVKNGIRKQNIRLPFVHVTYIAKVAQQILRPEEHMYLVINRFLLRNQFLDLQKVPDFFKLFYSFDHEHKLEREWVLNVLEEGIRDKLCYEICEQQNVYQTLLGFGSCPLSDQSSQILIVNVLHKTAHITRAAYDLIKKHGVLTWILQMIGKRYIDSRLLSRVIELLHKLWFTNLGDKESQTEASDAFEERPQTSGKCLPLPIINEFLSTLLTLIRHLGGAVAVPQMKAFLQTLSSVLMHCGTVLNAHKEAGWLTLHPRKPSCSEILSVLQRWGTLAKDTFLLSALQSLADKHNVKELLGSGQGKRGEKGQGKSHSAKYAPFRTEKQDDTEDGQSDNLVQTLLEDCKPLLRDILIHWEPKVQEPSCAISERFTTNKPDASDLDDAVACLVVKWTLKTLTESPYVDSNTLAVLKWVQRIVLPRADILDALSDESTRKDFLKLYHQTCEHTAQEQRFKAETLQLFSAIMIQMLEANCGSVSDIHQTVISTCLPSDVDDDAKTETGLKLLSLYIYEMWSGAQSPGLLLTHARLLCRDNRTSMKKSKSHVLHMCKQILSAVKP
ncbi:Nucleolar pre-ribosomal-associated protein 1 [Triplophysa tibetana]|uniref:Nucleolar pre-ribosomal-associated protein 1 n=1 Tax=Triplophysa tibetana TaxID=1572043 RepID=A0A5A9MZL9_9TELE|nr:Nucleolar pre-ribosomal-associated protein 1 [Triplophysa tibetana]